MRTRLLLGLSLLGLAACQGTETSAPNQPTPPSLTIVDGSHAGNADFFFLPPLVLPTSSYSNWTTNGFNGALSPSVVVCRLNATTAAAVTAGTACMASPAPVTISGADVKKHFPPLADPNDVISGLPGDWAHYHAKYALPSNCTTKFFYRIRVKVGATELGFADVQCVTKVLELLKVDYKKFGAGLKGLNVQIPFRIERYALCPIPGIGPCGSASIALAAGGQVTFKDEGGHVEGLVNIPAQGGPSTPPVTVTVTPCSDPAGLPVDLPKFGNCITVTTDPAIPDLSPTAQASVYVCHAVDDDALDALPVAQRKRVTLHRQNGTALQALPHTDVDACPPETVGAAPSSIGGLVNALVHREWKQARKQIFGLVAPRALYARRLDVGAGGKTRAFSNFQLALPAIMTITDGDGQVALPGEEVATDPEVTVTDLGGDPVVGATVRFLAGAGGQPNPEVLVVTTGPDGKASHSWTLAAAPGANTLTASGRGIASPTDNGPRGCDDPFQAIQAPPKPPEFGGCGEGGNGPSETAVDLHTGSVTFNATGAYPGDPLPIEYLSGGWSYQIGDVVPETWNSSLASPFILTGLAGFGFYNPDDNCSLIQTGTQTAWAPNTTLYVRRTITLDEARVVRIDVAIDNDVQIFVDGDDGGTGLQTHDGCPSPGSNYRQVSLDAGTHVIAIRAVDRGGSTYFDARIWIVPQ